MPKASVRSARMSSRRCAAPAGRRCAIAALLHAQPRQADAGGPVAAGLNRHRPATPRTRARASACRHPALVFCRHATRNPPVRPLPAVRLRLHGAHRACAGAALRNAGWPHRVHRQGVRDGRGRARAAQRRPGTGVIAPAAMQPHAAGPGLRVDHVDRCARCEPAGRAVPLARHRHQRRLRDHGAARRDRAAPAARRAPRVSRRRKAGPATRSDGHARDGSVAPPRLRS